MTRIELLGFGVIDIAEGTNFPLNLSVQNVIEPLSNASSFSKDIEIVGTKETNKILSQAYSINVVDGSFDVNKKVECQVYQKDVCVFDNAFFQLVNVNRIGDRIKYTGRVKSDLLAFFTKLKNDELTDISLANQGEYTTLTKENVFNSFDNTYLDKWKFAQHFSTSNVLSVRNFKPAVYLRTYFDAIHEQSGYTYEFEEAEELNFNKLLLPSVEKFDPENEVKDFNTFNGGQVLEDLGTVEKKAVLIGAAAHYESRSIDIVEVSDPANNFVDGVWTAPFVGEFDFRQSTKARVNLFNSTADTLKFYTDGAGATLDIDFFVIYRIDRGTGTIETVKLKYGANIQNLLRVGGTADTEFQLVSGNNFFDIELDNSYSRRLWKGDKIIDVQIGYNRRRISSLNTGFSVNANDPRVEIDYKLSVIDLKQSITPRLEYNYDAPIWLNQFIPKKIKQRDLIKSVLDLYGLVVEMDESDPTKLVYKTRNKYYDEGQLVDWSKKLARDRSIKTEWINQSQGHSLTLSYKEDKDAANEGYFDATKEVYGEYKYTFGNEYNIGDARNTLIFSPTPTVKGQFNNMFTPMMTSEPEKSYNIRLLFDGGTRNDGYYLFENPDGSYPDEVETLYKLNLHVDDPINPSFDLNFGQCGYYFYNDWIAQTRNNLFNLFHRRLFSQLEKGKKMMAYFRLTPSDIANIHLNAKVKIDDTFWNINKIIDYNANKEGLTKVELVTIDDGVSILPEQNRNIEIPSLGDTKLLQPTKTLISEQEDSTNTEGTATNTKIYGTDNTINSTEPLMVIGNDNEVNEARLVVGDGLVDSGDADILTKSIRTDEVKIKNLEITEDGLSKTVKYVEDGYVEEDYVEEHTVAILYGDESITFDTVILIADKLPTSDADLPSGAIWRNGNDLKIKI